jgi:hypothetical protein
MRPAADAAGFFLDEDKNARQIVTGITASAQNTTAGKSKRTLR